jgi:D-glycero-alpha-D-manno-heptose-7-phosphate kinase
MIISKTPVRISFFGGGTDYPDHFIKNGGGVLSTSIDKYIFVTVKPSGGISEHKYRVAYSRLEQCDDLEEIQHPVVREVIRFLHITQSLEINVVSDLPARTGIGSSSSFTVGLLHALHALKGNMVSKQQLASEAVHIEQVVLKERVGVQDQYAAAFGGFNQIEFSKTGNIVLNPVCIPNGRKVELQSNLIMFYTGISRFAHKVLEEQIQKTKDNAIVNDLARMHQMVEDGLQILCTGKDLRLFGELLHEGWMAKRSLSSAISNTFLDEIYENARKAGAIGGKLLGAGGGGFFVFFAEPGKRGAVRKALSEFPEVSFTLENDGTRIIHFS